MVYLHFVSSKDRGKKLNIRKLRRKRSTVKLMNNKVRSRVNNLIVVMTVIVFALSLIATAFFAFPADLSALTDINSATKIGGGKELYNKDRGNFNIGVVSDFIEKLFGDEDPVEYIKTDRKSVV